MKHVGNWVCVVLLGVLVVGCVSFGPVGAGELVGKWAGTVTRDADGGTMQVAFEFRGNGDTFKASGSGSSGVFTRQ